MMYITWLEMKKALFSPIILFLLVIFISFNIFSIISGADNRDELKLINDIVEKYGLTFDEDSLHTMQEDLNEDVQNFNSNFQDANAFLESMTFEKYYEANKDAQQEIDRINRMQMYIHLGKNLDTRYKALTIEQLRDFMIQQFNLNGISKRYVTNEFKKLSTRLEEMKENAEYKQWFFAGEYRMHSQLFRELLKNIAIEGVMLVVLLTALIVNYEIEHRTQLLTYATKRGRQLVWNKLFASLLSTFLVLVPLFGVSLLLFFGVYDYSGLWETRISSGLNWEYKWPYVTWWPVEFQHYLGLAIAILVMSLLIVSLLTFTISIFVKNSYFTWIMGILFLISMYVVPSFFSGIPIVLILLHFNVTLLLVNPHLYFSAISNLTMFEHHEIITLTCWLAVVAFCTFIAIRRFYRKDIV
ncbi:hypothetical protein ACLM5H_20180 [Fredinandcohnia humi]